MRPVGHGWHTTFMPNSPDAPSSAATTEPESPPSPRSVSEQRTAHPGARFSGAGHRCSEPKRTLFFATVAVGLMALTVILFGIARPPRPIFDELFYVPAARALLYGALNMDPGEPPMGKLAMAVGLAAGQDNSFGWRVSGGVCGALSVVAIFLWTQLLFGELKVSLYAAAFTLFNNILFVMSRVAMVDVFLVFFMVWAMLAGSAAFLLEGISPAKRRILLCCSGFLFGLGGSCKWNAVDTLAALLAMALAVPVLARFVRGPSSPSLHRLAENLRHLGMPSLLFALLVVPLLSYSLVDWVLYRFIVHLPFGFHDLVQINGAIWKYHRNDGVLLSMFRHWYEWPFMASPARALSYLMGNPVVSWGGFAAILLCLWRGLRSLAVPEALVGLLYAANLLQWAVTPARGAYYYYYFPASMFLGVALAYAVHRLPRTFFGIRPAVVLMAAAVVVFIWCYPRMAHLDAPWDCALGCWA